MNHSHQSSGFSLIELLMVLSLIGIVTAIAVPALSGAKTHARISGDAKTNSATLRMALETYRADLGMYPPAGSYVWKPDGTVPALSPAVNFVIKGASQMQFTLDVDASRLKYTITAVDTVKGNQVLKQDQNGALVP